MKRNRFAHSSRSDCMWNVRCKNGNCFYEKWKIFYRRQTVIGADENEPARRKHNDGGVQRSIGCYVSCIIIFLFGVRLIHLLIPDLTRCSNSTGHHWNIIPGKMLAGRLDMCWCVSRKASAWQSHRPPKATHSRTYAVVKSACSLQKQMSECYLLFGCQTKPVPFVSQIDKCWTMNRVYSIWKP